MLNAYYMTRGDLAKSEPGSVVHHRRLSEPVAKGTLNDT